MVSRLAPALVLLAAMALPERVASAEEWSLASPDGRTTIVLTLSAEGRLSWRAARGGAAVIADSPLGIRRADQAFTDGLKLVRASEPRVADERYQTVHGKRRIHQVHARERTVLLVNAGGGRLEISLRAHDDDVAFRDRLPETDPPPRSGVEERTASHVPAGTTAWLLPHHMPSRYKPAYEDLFREVPVGTTAPEPAGWSFPGLFKTTAGPWMLVTEAALDETYCG